MPIPSYILPSAPAYTEDSVYALIPTPSTPIYTPDAISFTRGSDATRTASNGLIQRSPWNLLRYSEEFSNSAWTKNGCTISANVTVAPNGTLTADKLIPNNGQSPVSGDSSLLVQSLAINASIYTYSIYAKAAEFTSIRFRETNFSGQLMTVDLTNGSITGGGSQFGNPTAINVGDGWYRISFTSNSTTLMSLANQYAIRCASTGDGTSGIFIWGAQLVEGSQPLTYFPTTDRLNVPRIDFSQGSCPALLLEPQRTNLALYSDQFDSATWTKNASATITANSTTAPDGNTNADTLTVAALTFSGIYRVISGASANYTVSIYAKKDTKNWLYIVDIQGSAARAWFNLDSGVLGTVASGYSATITSVGNGWYRCTLTNTTALSALYYQFGLSDSDNSTTPTSSGSAFIYGAQIEVGSYATTYIPTTSTSVTRLADSFSKSNIYTNGLITAAGGTWYVELRSNLAYKGDAAGDGIFLRTIGDTDNFRLYSDNLASSRIVIYKRVSNINSVIYTTTTDTTKIAIKWNGSTADVFANGTKVVSATAFTATQLQDLIGFVNASPKFIQSMALFSTPLSDAALITMTT